MSRTLLRAPTGAAEVVADVLRMLGVISIVVAGVGWGPLSAVSFLSAVVVMLAPGCWAFGRASTSRSVP